MQVQHKKHLTKHIPVVTPEQLATVFYGLRDLSGLAKSGTLIYYTSQIRVNANIEHETTTERRPDNLTAKNKSRTIPPVF